MRILYLHGFASSPSSQKAQFFRQRLAEVCHSIQIPDLVSGDFEHLTVTGQLGVIEKAACGEPALLIGSSLGGYLAALYAARHPEVPRVVLLAPAFGFARRFSALLSPEQLETWRRTNRLEVFHYGDKRNRPVGYQLLEDAARYEAYPDFRQPALIFHGANDEHVPVSCSQEFAASHPQARLEIVDSGHDLLNVLEFIATRVVAFVSNP